MIAVHERGDLWVYARARRPDLRPVRTRLFVPYEDFARIEPLVIRLPAIAESRLRILLPGTPGDSCFELDRMREGFVASSRCLEADGSIPDDEPALKPEEVIRIRHRSMPISVPSTRHGAGSLDDSMAGSGVKLRLRSATGPAIDTAEVYFDRFLFPASPADFGCISRSIPAA